MLKGFFKGKAKGQGAGRVDPISDVQAAENPYLAARREWMERYGDFIAGKESWKMATFAITVVAAVSVAGNVYQGSQSKVQPFVVKVNGWGDPIDVQPADKGQKANDTMIAAQVARWIVESRSVTTDPVVQKQWLARVYALSSQNTQQFLNDWYAKHSPFDTARLGARVTVTVQQPMPLSDKTWSVEWEEEKRGPQNEFMGKERWKALVPVTVFVPETVKQLMANPSGVIIEPPSWTQQL